MWYVFCRFGSGQPSSSRFCFSIFMVFSFRFMIFSDLNFNFDFLGYLGSNRLFGSFIQESGPQTGFTMENVFLSLCTFRSYILVPHRHMLCVVDQLRSCATKVFIFIYYKSMVVQTGTTGPNHGFCFLKKILDKFFICFAFCKYNSEFLNISGEKLFSFLFIRP